MAFFKKEWKTIVITLWLVAITFLLSSINGHLKQLQATNAKLASTLDSVESVSLSTDSTVLQSSKKVDDIFANTTYIVEKIRRR